MIRPDNIDKLSDKIDKLPPVEAIGRLCEWFPGKVVFSTSLGQEDQVITQMIAENRLNVEVFTLDTGRLFYETYDLLSKTVLKYNLDVKIYYPDTASVEGFVRDNGINSFYDSVENRKGCCYVRKVEPLKRALKGNSIWITGLRSEQSSNRSAMNLLEWDEGNQIIKFNPLLRWSMEDLLAYIREYHIPCNVLHDTGFASIGCAPCTRAILPGEDPRAGRWWWETSQKECGLHSSENAVNKA